MYGVVPPVAVVLKVTDCPASGEVEETLKVVESGRLVYTVMERVLVAVFVGVEESAAVSVTVNDPAVVYLWVVVAPVAVVPSPKFQLIA